MKHALLSPTYAWERVKCGLLNRRVNTRECERSVSSEMSVHRSYLFLSPHSPLRFRSRFSARSAPISSPIRHTGRALLRRKNRLMRRGRTDEADALATHVRKAITRHSTKWLRNINTRQVVLLYGLVCTRLQHSKNIQSCIASQ